MQPLYSHLPAQCQAIPTSVVRMSKPLPIIKKDSVISSAGVRQRGIQSIEVGGQLLLALVRAGNSLALKDVAQQAGMTAAKAHPYLVSFSQLGLVVQGPNGLYGLGPLALQMGAIALQQADPVQVASSALPAIARAFDGSASVAVWSSQGPIIVHSVQGPRQVNVTMRLGMTASLLETATGRVFSALLPAAEVEPVIKAQGLAKPWRSADFQRCLQAVRDDGLAQVRDVLIDGVMALGVPIYNGLGQPVVCIAVIGPHACWQAYAKQHGAGAAQKDLLAHAAQLSAQLGYYPR